MKHSLVKTDLLEDTRKLGHQQAGVSAMFPEVLVSLNLNRSTLQKAFSTGLDPDLVVEKVIKAIENQIFYKILEL